MPDWTEEAVIVESVDPAQGGGISTAEEFGQDRCRQMTSAL